MINKVIGLGAALFIGARVINPWLLTHFTRPVLLRHPPLQIKYNYASTLHETACMQARCIGGATGWVDISIHNPSQF